MVLKSSYLLMSQYFLIGSTAKSHPAQTAVMRNPVQVEKRRRKRRRKKISPRKRERRNR
jgi:hypothetical protein